MTMKVIYIVRMLKGRTLDPLSEWNGNLITRKLNFILVILRQLLNVIIEARVKWILWF